MTYSGVFILSEMVARDLEGEGLPLSQVFTQRPDAALPDIGYNTGGWQSGTQRSNTDKLTFSNDTWAAAPSADMSVARTEGQAAGNASFGYIVGGLPPSTNVDRITYSSDTGAAVPGAFLPNPGLHRAGSNGSNTNGYFSGGNAPGLNAFTNTYRLVYASETSSRIPGMDLTAARQYCVGAGNADIGFILGQSPGPTSISNTTKQTFSTETCSNTPSSGDLSGAKYRPGGFGDTTHAYFAGGNPGLLSTVDRIQISNDTRSTLPATGSLEEGRNSQSTQGSNSLAYNTAGFSTPGVNTNSDKLVYSTETMSRLGGGITAGRYRSMGVGPKEKGKNQNQSFPVQQFTTGIQPGPYVGYSVNGTTPAATQSTVDKLDLATDTSSATNNFVRSGNNAGNLSKVDAGYYCGGSSPEVSFISKLTFSTDTSAAVSGNLTGARYGIGAAGNNTFGYLFAGRNSGAVATTVDKLTYSTETAAAVSTAALTATVYGTRAMGNGGVGYVMGGFVPPSWPGPTTIQKITYSTDTRSILSGTITDVGGRYLAGVANKEDFGYLMGGGTGSGLISSTDKFSLISETATLAPSAAELSLVKSAQSTYSNGSTDAYNCGGSNPGGSANYSTCEKITYQTDTRAVVPGGAMSSTRYQVMGFSPRQFTLPNQPRPTPTPQEFVELVGFDGGYYIGGHGMTSVEKMNFTTDTSSRTSNDLAASMSLGGTPGGFSGPTGSYVTSGFRTDIQKVTYTNDTTSTISAEFAAARYNRAAFMSPSHGYLGGGGPGPLSTVDKFAFSDETLSVTNPMTIARQDVYSVGNKTQGYFMGSNPRTTTVSKYTFSTDTDATIPAQLPEPSGKGCGAGNADIAYVNTGDNPSDPSTVMFKLTYSTDTISSAPDIAAAHYTGGGVSNSTAAYLMGGGTPSTPSTSTIHKITFATGGYETLNPMSQGKRRGSGTGPRSNDFSSPSPVNC